MVPAFGIQDAKISKSEPTIASEFWNSTVQKTQDSFLPALSVLVSRSSGTAAGPVRMFGNFGKSAPSYSIKWSEVELAPSLGRPWIDGITGPPLLLNSNLGQFPYVTRYC